MKKIISAILCLFLCVFSSFALFVTDLQSIFQTILQTMENAEQYVATKLKWVEDLEQYKRQAEQIIQYYEQLKGITDKFGDGNFLDIWNQSREILKKTIELTGAVAEMEERTANNILYLINFSSEVMEYINSYYSSENPFNKKVDAIYNNFSNTATWYYDSFYQSLDRSSSAYKNVVANLNSKKQMYNQLIDVNSTQLKEINDKLNDIEDKVKSATEFIEQEENMKKINLNSLALIQNSSSKLSEQIIDAIKAGTLTDASREEFQLLSSDYKSQMDVLNKIISTEENNIYKLKNEFSFLLSNRDDLKIVKKFVENDIRSYQNQLLELEKIK